MLYLEGSTDLLILQAFAKSLDHAAQQYLARPFVKDVVNQPQQARAHFHGLHYAKNDLVGIAIFDRLDRELQSAKGLTEIMWRRREIENYFCTEDVLLAYARHDWTNDLFERSEGESQHREQAMRGAIVEVTKLLEIDDLDPWSPDVKASDHVLDRVFKLYFKKLALPLQLRKSVYHILAGLVPKEKLDAEVAEKLDAIVAVAKKAKPRTA